MRHAARLPPPPVFNDRRLLQLIAFSKLHIIDHSFGVCVFYLWLTLAYFCRYLYVLDVCCQFASCRATWAICKYYCKKCFRNASKIKHISIIIHPKSIKNPKKWCPGAFRKRSWDQIVKESPATLILLLFFRRHLGDFGRHFGHRWVPRGAKIEHFAIREHQKSEI